MLFLNIILLATIVTVSGLIEDKPMPRLLYECFYNQTSNKDITVTPSYSVFTRCRDFYWAETAKDRYHTDLDPAVYNYVQKLEGNLNLFHRQKRQTGRGGNRWRPVLRRRREIRTLTDIERQSLFNAIVQLKLDRQLRPNVYDALANLHNGAAIQSAHFGPNFLGWHRYFCYIFEQALRTKNPSVTLPYWDSSFDFNMQLDDPVDSIVWTNRFFGPGNGFLNSGPFSFWRDANNGFVVRNIGSPGSLMTPSGIQAVLTQRFHRDIVQPTSSGLNDLEGQHNNVHAWIGGHMAGLSTSPFDPVFFFHHCFIDYLWEQFRLRQFRRGINPQNDYPNTGVPGHWPWSTMTNLGRIRNIDGYHNAFTQFIYTYDPSPTCADNCGGSRYLECDANRRVCVSTTWRHFPTPSLPPVSGFTNLGAPAASMMRNTERMTFSNNPRDISANALDRKFQPLFIDPRTKGKQTFDPSASMMRNRERTAESNTLQEINAIAKTIEKFRPSFLDPRVLSGSPEPSLEPGHNNNSQTIGETKFRRKRQVYNPNIVSSKGQSFQQNDAHGDFGISESSISMRTPFEFVQSSFSDVSRAPNNIQSHTNQYFNNHNSHQNNVMDSHAFTRAPMSAEISVTKRDEEAASHSFIMDIPTVPDTSEKSGFIDETIQNTFIIDGVADADKWVFTPVKIIYKRPPGTVFNSKIVKNGNIIQGPDFYAPAHYSNLQRQIRTGVPASYPKEVHSGSGASKVFVTSDGLTYSGRYIDYAIIDERQPISETVTYIAFKNPRFGLSQAYVSVYDANGRICHPRCQIRGSVPIRYKSCSGVISITDMFPKMFGNNYGDAVLSRYSFDNRACPTNKDSDIFLVFYCDYENRWPWIGYPNQ